MSTAEVLMTAMMVLITVLIAGGIPWGYAIGQKVTRIEAKLTNGISNRIEKHSDDLDSLDQRIGSIENFVGNISPEHLRRVKEQRQRRDSGQS